VNSTKRNREHELARLAAKGIIPNGICWCGCGQATTGLSFFRQGHDRTAIYEAIEKHFGSTVEFLIKMKETK
jgi:hypothetical protein